MATGAVVKRFFRVSAGGKDYFVMAQRHEIRAVKAGIMTRQALKSGSAVSDFVYEQIELTPLDRVVSDYERR